MRVFYIIFIVIVQALCRDYPFAELVQNYTTAFFSCVKNSGINRTVVLLLSTQY